jgi:dihydrofolate reductase
MKRGGIEMGRIVVSEFVTVDGYMQDPGGAEGLAGGGYAFRFDRGPEGDAYKVDEVMDAEALLLGRVTYEGFAAAWPGRTDEAGFADKMNSMPKYVVSASLQKPEWANTTVLGGDVAQVAKLKEQIAGTILVAGSARLVHALTKLGLVDEYRLMVFPTMLGAGARLFTDTGRTADLRLTEAKPVGPDGVVVLTYVRT